jgi:hypothetical protein
MKKLNILLLSAFGSGCTRVGGTVEQGKKT